MIYIPHVPTDAEWQWQHALQWCAENGHDPFIAILYADHFVNACSGLQHGEWPLHSDCYAAWETGINMQWYATNCGDEVTP